MKKELLKIETISEASLTPAVVIKKIDAMRAAQAKLDKHKAELEAMIEKKYDTTYTNVESLIGNLLA